MDLLTVYTTMKAEYYSMWKNAKSLKESDKYFKLWQTTERWIEKLLTSHSGAA